MIRIESTIWGKAAGVRVFDGNKMSMGPAAGTDWDRQLDLPYYLDGEAGKSESMALRIKLGGWLGRLKPLGWTVFVGDADMETRKVDDNFADTPGVVTLVEASETKDYMLRVGQSVTAFGLLRVFQQS